MSGSDRPYQPPEGFEDRPMTWVYNTQNLQSGQPAANQAVQILKGWGEFWLRRIVGFSNVVAPGGTVQIQDDLKDYMESAPIFIPPAPGDDMAIVPETRYRENGAIRFDISACQGGVQGLPFGVTNASFADTISTVAGLNVEGIQNGDVGPFSNGNNRYVILQDGTAFVFRCFKSTNQGQTWAEIDSAHHPSYSTDAPAPHFFGFFAVAASQDPATQKLFLVYFSTAQVVTMIPFNMATDTWGVAVPSGVGYTNPALGTSDISGLAAIHRGVDNTLIVGFSPVQSAVGDDVASILKLNITAGTWDAAWTPVGDPLALVGEWEIYGFARGSNNNIHILMGQQESPAQNSAIWMQVLRPNNTISALNLVFKETNNDEIVTVTRPVSYQVSSTNEILIAFLRFNNRLGSNVHLMAITVARALSSETPNWTIQNVVTGLDSTKDYVPGVAIAVTPGKLYLFYFVSFFASNLATLSYITNSKASLPWSSPVDVVSQARANFEAASNLDFMGASFMSATGSIGILFPYFKSGALSGYWELTPANPYCQVAFQGIGRFPAVHRTVHKFKPKTFTYTGQAIITATGNLVQLGSFAGNFGTAQPISLLVKVTDYDFELLELAISYSSGGSSVSLPSVIASLMLYDAYHNQAANSPVLDLYWNGQPLSGYKNGAQVPSLIYPLETHLRLDFFSLIQPSVAPGVLPVTANVHFKGIQRIPC